MARIPYVPRRKYQLQHMWDKHKEVLRLTLLGVAPKDIATELNCTPENICQITGSEIFKRELQVFRAARDTAAIDVARAIQDIGPKCLQLLEDVLDNNKDKLGENCPVALRAGVAQDLLDRHAKTAKVKHIDGAISVNHIATTQTIQELKDRAKAIEAEFEVIDEPKAISV